MHTNYTKPTVTAKGSLVRRTLGGGAGNTVDKAPLPAGNSATNSISGSTSV
jgi:hypothetical protein